MLTSWMLDLATARQLKMQSTGHASRGGSSPPFPSPTNLYMNPGKLSPQALMEDIKDGIYVTQIMGHGTNMTTGDYSQGASGFLIENGKITKPVSEFTIAGNLLEMFQDLTPASNLEFEYSVNAPTVRIDGMKVAGQG